MGIGVREGVVWVLRGYQLTLSAFLGRQCRFEPTCSAYTMEAVRRFGVGKGLILGLNRVRRCGPGGGGRFQGKFDPVPQVWHWPWQRKT